MEILQELRVAITGGQILFAFLLTVPFSQRFIAPAAGHRLRSPRSSSGSGSLFHWLLRDPAIATRIVAFRVAWLAVERLNVTLDDEQAAKLERLAGRMALQPGTIARSLLSRAIDDADPDATNVVDLLDASPDAFARATLGRRQAGEGRTIGLDEL